MLEFSIFIVTSIFWTEELKILNVPSHISDMGFRMLIGFIEYL
jgi:hypothetical protein